MRVLVVGGSGYVGSHIVQALKDAGHDVQTGSRSSSQIRLDLRTPESLHRALEGQDVVVHAVGLIRSRRLRGQTFARVVEAGTKNVVAAAKAAGINRIVLISANGIDARHTPYQRTKWAAEEAVRASGIPFTIFRPSIVFGSDDEFTNLLRRMLRFGGAPYFGRGDYAMAPVAAADLAWAVAASLTDAKADGATYSVCGPQAVTYRELLRTIRHVSRSRGIVFRLPVWMARTAALTLGWLPGFPATNAAITMLLQGNVCADDSWTRIGDGRTPLSFEAGVAAYLAPKGRRKR